MSVYMPKITPHLCFDDQAEEAVNFYVSNCDTQEEIDLLWDKLSDGGVREVCGWLKDKYGVYWQIYPKIAWEMINDPEPDKSRRASAAIDGMTKSKSNLYSKRSAMRG